MMTAFFMKSFLEYSHGIPVIMDLNTTLNEKYEVLLDKTILSSVMPKVRYFGVGVGGVGIPKTAYHHGLDADLFEPIPLIAREVSNDLTTTDRLKYRMRVEKEIGGVRYALYYLRNIDDTLDKVSVKSLTKSKDDPTIAKVMALDFNTATMLNPVARENDDLDLDTAKFFLLECGLSFSFTELEKEDLILAYQLVTGNTDTPEVSEVCIYSGEDTYVDGVLEAYGVRSAYFYTMPHELQSFPSEEGGFQRYINVSGSRLYK